MTTRPTNVVDLFSRIGGDGRRIDPARLREARKAAGLNQRELADAIGVSRQIVSQWEQGAKCPDGSTMFRVAERLGQPLSYFTGKRPEPFGQSTSAFYRAFGPQTKKRNDQCDAWKEWLVETAAFFAGVVRWTSLQLIDWEAQSTDGSYTPDEIEAAAKACRRAWGLGDGPIANVVALLENKGIVVTRLDFGAEQVNAFSYWNGGQPFIFLSSDKGSCARARWDASHELAHLILHRGITHDELESPTTLKRIEREADRFAGAFLLPESTYPNEVLTTRLEGFEELKRRWKVSIQAQIYRCEELGIFSEEQILNMRKSVSKRRWRKIEPLDDQMPLEEPGLLRKCLDLVTSSGVMDKHAVLSGINLNPDYIAAFCGVPPTFFKATEPIVGPTLK